MNDALIQQSSIIDDIRDSYRMLGNFDSQPLSPPDPSQKQINSIAELEERLRIIRATIADLGQEVN